MRSPSRSDFPADLDGPPTMPDIHDVRRRARRAVEEGPVSAERGIVLRLLDEALATELVCMLRVRRHHYAMRSQVRPTLGDALLERANEALRRADRIAERIVELRGIPDLDPATLLDRSRAEYRTGTSVTEMLREDLVAEHVMIESYGQMIAYLGDRDPTTLRLLEELLGEERDLADRLTALLLTHAGRPE